MNESLCSLCDVSFSHLHLPPFSSPLSLSLSLPLSPPFPSLPPSPPYVCLSLCISYEKKQTKKLRDASYNVLSQLGASHKLPTSTPLRHTEVCFNLYSFCSPLFSCSLSLSLSLSLSPLPSSFLSPSPFPIFFLSSAPHVTLSPSTHQAPPHSPPSEELLQSIHSELDQSLAKHLDSTAGMHYVPYSYSVYCTIYFTLLCCLLRSMYLICINVDNCMIDIHIFHTISVVFMFNTIATICQTNCEAVQHDLFNDPFY